MDRIDLSSPDVRRVIDLAQRRAVAKNVSEIAQIEADLDLSVDVLFGSLIGSAT
jgi:hypothetical protein